MSGESAVGDFLSKVFKASGTAGSTDFPFLSRPPNAARGAKLHAFSHALGSSAAYFFRPKESSPSLPLSI
jgi:hypothetical protein